MGLTVMGWTCVAFAAAASLPVGPPGALVSHAKCVPGP